MYERSIFLAISKAEFLHKTQIKPIIKIEGNSPWCITSTILVTSITSVLSIDGAISYNEESHHK